MTPTETGRGCLGPDSPLKQFDPLRPDHCTDPFPWFSRARRESPVFYMPKYDMWAVTRHADCLRVLRDPETFSNVGAMDVRVPLPEALRDMAPKNYVFPIASDSLTVLDPPRHTRQRKAIQPTMGPKKLNARIGEITVIADRLIDGFVADGSVELMERFAFRFPIEVFSPLLGISVEETASLLRWVDGWFRIVASGDVPDDRAIACWKGLLDWDAWTRRLIDERRERPGEDVVSHMICAIGDDGGRALDNDELVANICNFVAGGVDTTAYLIGQLVCDLLVNELWDDVRADRGLIPGAVEESMRLLGPVRSVRRRVTRTVELGGVEIPKDAELWLAFHSANRDEAAFDCPDAFQIRRPNKSRGSGFGQLGFGNGLHFCVGAPLARLEARIALDRLVERLPAPHLAKRADELEYAISFVLPGLRRLDLRWDV
jgi:cytochrome P450